MASYYFWKSSRWSPLLIGIILVSLAMLNDGSQVEVMSPRKRGSGGRHGGNLLRAKRRQAQWQQASGEAEADNRPQEAPAPAPAIPAVIIEGSEVNEGGATFDVGLRSQLLQTKHRTTEGGAVPVQR